MSDKFKGRGKFFFFRFFVVGYVGNKIDMVELVIIDVYDLSEKLKRSKLLFRFFVVSYVGDGLVLILEEDKIVI